MRLEQQPSSTHQHGLRLVDNPHAGPPQGSESDFLGNQRPVIGNSVSISRCLELAKRAAESRSTVILLGESGTGKEIFARAILRWSDRSNQPFVAINCVGLSRELLESELFGHEKGAFTGAHQLKKGKIELAHGGTVFLDEIGDLSMDLQVKLLRFLQEREFERVGGTRSIRVDVRIIAATNRDLSERIRSGNFREDLYYRLNVVCITLPALRERREDVPELARFFLNKSANEARKNFLAISSDAMEKLCAYCWPGNVRELANVIEQAVVLGQEPILTSTDLPMAIISDVLSQRPVSNSYRDAVSDFRRNLIAQALGDTGGNQAAAARRLGLHRKYLQRLIKTLNIA